MPGCTGDFDHFGSALKGNRLFLAAEDHKTVEVFNLRTGKRIHSIEGFGHPLMMAYLPESNHLVVTDGGESAVQFSECKYYKIIKTVKLVGEIDHGVLNPLNRYYYMESGDGSGGSTHALSIVGIKSLAHGDIPGLPGVSIEGMIIDRAGRKLYVNLTGTDEVKIAVTLCVLLVTISSIVLAQKSGSKSLFTRAIFVCAGGGFVTMIPFSHPESGLAATSKPRKGSERPDMKYVKFRVLDLINPRFRPKIKSGNPIARHGT